MKGKMITAVATALIVGFSAMNASAWNGGHQGQMMEHGMMNGGAYNANVSSETLVEINKIKVKMAADQTELTALMSSANPDTQRIRTLSEQISTSQSDLQKKHGAAGSGYGHGMIYKLFKGSRPGTNAATDKHDSLKIFKARFARGEISLEEYQRMKEFMMYQ